MSRVPDGWRETPLKNLAQVLVSPVDKKSHPDELPVRLCNYMDVYSNHRISSDMDFMTATATAAQIAKFSVAEHDVLITKDSETPRDIAIPALMVGNFEDVVCGYHLAILRPKPSTLCGEFLHHCLQADSVRDYFFRVATGSTRFGLSVGGIENAPIVLPPLPEQKKIAAILSSVDDAIAATQAVIDQTRTVKEGLLQDLLTRGIGHTRFKQTEIGEIPEGWEVKRLEEVMGAIIDYRGKSPNKSDAGVPLITAKNVRDGFISEEPREFIDEGSFDEWMIRGDLFAGDVLFTTEAPLGNVAKVPEGRLAIAQRLIALRGKKGIVENAFLYWVLRSEVFKQQVDLLATGTTAKGIKQSNLRKVLLPIPSIVEQKRLAATMDLLEAGGAREVEKAQQLIVLKRALMQDLLSGSVRVTTP